MTKQISCNSGKSLFFSIFNVLLLFSTSVFCCLLAFVFVSLFLFLFHNSTAQVFLLPCTWDSWGKKYSGYHKSPSHYQMYTLLQSWAWCIFSIISECGRALKYIICGGKNWVSIIPKRDAKNWPLLQRPNPNILPTILPKAPIILCRRDYNRKGRLKLQISFCFLFYTAAA